ncbi:MAG: helix-turn-helix domain-containing protein [Clostridiales bacterium]|nr:helix-turn-helix domain-containing protein [Clostridiales bacterium]
MNTEKTLLKQKPKLLLYAGYYHPRKLKGERLHNHEFCEIMFVKEGSGNVMIDNVMHPIKKGDIVIYNPLTYHAEYFDRETCDEVMFFGFSRLNVECFAPGTLCDGLFKILHTGKYFDEFSFYCDQLLKEKNAKEFQYSAISESLLNILISYILRLSDDTKITENTNTCNQIKDYLDKNYTSNKSIDDICRDLYINKYYLTHLFKDAMGVPPLKYMITKRISLAKELLTTTDLTIEEVAIKCGYSDTTYFIKVFKKAEGITPIEFKNQQIEN